MSKTKFSFGDPLLDAIMFFIGTIIVLMLGIFIGGPILSALTLKDGWDDTDWRIKTGAIFFTLIGGGAIFYYTFIESSKMTSIWDVLITVSPIISIVLLALALKKKSEGML